ncbi:MAG: MOSC domain-containing protein [Candidatus Dormibacteria bacterium]
MEVAELWRYPVKSLAGERMDACEMGQRGIPGDRGVAAFELAPHPSQNWRSARDVPQLLQFRARLQAGPPEVAGPELDWTPWDQPEVRSAISERCRREMELRSMPGGAFDDSPLLLVHLATLRSLGQELGAEVDRRRFRANLYLDGPGIEPHQEPQLAGRQIRCGAAVLEVIRGCERCSITTRDPDTWASWPQLLRHVVWAHQELVGVYCRVKVEGAITVGDTAELL